MAVKVIEQKKEETKMLLWYTKGIVYTGKGAVKGTLAVHSTRVEK